MNNNNNIFYVLNVAEKPSVAKEASRLLSNGQYVNIQSFSKYNPVHTFDYTLRDRQVKMLFTSVTGHIMGYKFDDQLKQWKNVDPQVLLTTNQLYREVDNDKKDVVKNLEMQATKALELILWLDCDREGEAIAFEVIEICQQKNRHLQINRAHFSAVTKIDIIRAITNLKQPDKNQAEAVETRQIIDLRIGACFTRFQTLTIRDSFNINSKVVSYGPCQFPTLGFVVERYKKIRDFISEPFWYINCKYNWIDKFKQKKITKFEWKRNRIYEKYSAFLMYEKCLINFETNSLLTELKARVVKLEEKPKLKWRPYPLATIQLQKLGTQKLRFSSHQVMEIAEKLYTKGFISYPRTETDQFPNTMNLQQLVEIQRNNHDWGEYAAKLIDENRYMQPKRGIHDDKAHPPIHPVKLLEGEATMEEKKIYEMIARHFLACCSDDAKGQETYMEIQIEQELFHAKGLVITEPNYLEVYVYDKWSESEVPNLILGEVFQPSELTLEEGKTQPPNLLTETELISLMDKNGIGTDATIHEHIKTIQERQYATKINQYFKPTNLGVALVEAYENLGFTLSQPHLRALMEQKMNEISKGRMQKDIVIQEIMEMMIGIFQNLKLNQQQFIQKVGQFLHDEQIAEGQQNNNLNNNNNNNVNNNFNNNNRNNNFNNNNRINNVQANNVQINNNVINQNGNNRPNNINNNINGSGNNINNSNNSINRSSSCGQQNQLVCFKCKQPGHYANNCPNNSNGNQLPKQQQQQQNQQNNQFRSNQPQEENKNQFQTFQSAATTFNNNNKGNQNILVCFKCQQPGHFANACPNQKINGPQSKSNLNNTNQSNFPNQNQNKNTQICFKCQKPGHFANNCPEKNKSTKVNNENLNNINQSNYQNKNQSDQQQKKSRKIKPCQVCGKSRHVKGSNCPGQKKKNKKQSKQDNQEENDFEQEENDEEFDNDNNIDEEN